MNKTQYTRDLRDKDAVSSPFLIKFSAVAVGKNGKPYMNLIFMDKTGEIEARLWDDVNQYVGQAVRDAFVWVEGRCQNYQGRRQIVVSKMQILREDEVNAAELLPEAQVDPNRLYAQLLEYVASMRDPFFKALAEAVLRDDPEIAEKIKIAPAAKAMHHAYPSGLIEHVVSITGILDALAAHYGKIVDRDLL